MSKKLFIFIIILLCACKSPEKSLAVVTDIVPSPIALLDEQNIQAKVILDVALSPDSSTLAIYANTGIYLYDIETLEKIVFQEVGNDDFRSRLQFRDDEYDTKLLAGAIAFSPDGKKIAVSDKFADRPIVVWEINSGNQVAVIRDIPNGYYVRGLEFSPTGDAIFIRSTYPWSMKCEQAEENLALIAFDTTDLFHPKKVLKKAQCGFVPATYRFTDSGDFYLFRRSMASTYSVTHANSAREIVLDEEFAYEDGELYDVSPEGNLLAIANYDEQRGTKLVDAETRKILTIVYNEVRFFRDDTQFLVHGFVDNKWELWSNENIVCTFDGIIGSPGWKISLDGKTFVVVTSNNDIQIWNISNCQIRKIVPFGK